MPVKLLPMDQFSNKVSFDAQGAYFSAISRPLYMTTNAETGEEFLKARSNPDCSLN